MLSLMMWSHEHLRPYVLFVLFLILIILSLVIIVILVIKPWVITCTGTNDSPMFIHVFFIKFSIFVILFVGVFFTVVYVADTLDVLEIELI